MGKLLFIDSDDINGLSEALREALERRGVVFKKSGTGEFDYPTTDDEEPDIDPYLGNMPNGSSSFLHPYGHGGCGSGGCGCRSGSACGGSTYEPSYGGCGGSWGC